MGKAESKSLTTANEERAVDVLCSRSSQTSLLKPMKIVHPSFLLGSESMVSRCSGKTQKIIIIGLQLACAFLLGGSVAKTVFPILALTMSAKETGGSSTIMNKRGTTRGPKMHKKMIHNEHYD
eukprot:5563959-Amphidinium_carterae.1